MAPPSERSSHGHESATALAPAPPPSENSSHGHESATALAPALSRPGDDVFLSHLATAGELVAASRFREAEVEVLRAISGLPADLRALNLLALVRFKLGRLDEARTTYREIAAATPNDASTRRHLGLLALKLERIDEAITELEMAARLAPGDQQAWSYLGYAYTKKGEPVPAAAAFRRAGQDALATELENAAKTRRPATGPQLGVAGLSPSGRTPPPTAVPLVVPPARDGTPIRGAAALHPSSVVSAGAAVAASPSSVVSAGAAVAASPSSVVSPSAAMPSSSSKVAIPAPASPPAPRAPISELRPGAVLPPEPAAVVIPPPVAAPAPFVHAPVVHAPVVHAPVHAAAPVADVAPAAASPELTGLTGELAPVPLLGFVLARLGLAATPPAPRGEVLRLGVDDDAYVRADAALAAVGVRTEAAFRRTQGRAGPEPLGAKETPFFRLVGPGAAWVAGVPGKWQAVSLEDDVLYVREDRVLAFDGGVSWEAGAIPGDGLRMLQFRGRGCVVLRLDTPPAAVKVTEDGPALVARDRLLGWVGRVVTHKHRGAGPSPFHFTCQGEGVVLFDSFGSEAGA
jgi:uncharacterized protein (AIM24 family)